MPTYWRRRQIDPVAELSLTQSVPREPLPLLSLSRFGGGSVLRQHVGQFGVGVNSTNSNLGLTNHLLVNLHQALVAAGLPCIGEGK